MADLFRVQSDNFLMQQCEWNDRAACQNYPAEWWDSESTRGVQKDFSEARRVCESCPVREQCLEWSIMAREDSGMYGGLDPKERALLRKRRKRRQ